MKALKIIGPIIGVIVVVILIMAALQPSEYLVAREMEMLAEPAAVFAHVNNVKKTDEWMAWKDMDPAVQSSYEGPEAGVGAVSKWESTGDMGTGRAEVIESIPNERVRTRVSYVKPMQMEQISEITLTPKGDATVVRWSVTGKNSFPGRVMCMFMNMDKMVGGMFEKGLAKLKAKVESK